jgi:hypothetical protein
VLAGDVRVSWVDDGGRRRSVGLETAAGVPFEDALPAREFLSYRGQRHFPGLWWVATTGRHVGYESWLERDHVMVLDGWNGGGTAGNGRVSCSCATPGRSAVAPVRPERLPPCHPGVAGPSDREIAN